MKRGEFVRVALEDSPRTIDQVYNLWREVRPRKGTYYSFKQYWKLLRSLAWVEPTGETDIGLNPDYDPPLVYRLTQEGLGASIDQWNDPIGAKYPEFAASTRGHRPGQQTGKVGRPPKDLAGLCT